MERGRRWLAVTIYGEEVVAMKGDSGMRSSRSSGKSKGWKYERIDKLGDDKGGRGGDGSSYGGIGGGEGGRIRNDTIEVCCTVS